MKRVFIALYCALLRFIARVFDIFPDSFQAAVFKIRTPARDSARTQRTILPRCGPSVLLA